MDVWYRNKLAIFCIDHKEDFALIKRGVEGSLFTYYFLQYAEPWQEGKMWGQIKVLDKPESLEMFSEFDVYMKTPVCSKSLDPIKPEENS